MKKVMIVSSSGQYSAMMTRAGWALVMNVEDADLVMFTGGADVNPALYGEEEHPKTFHQPPRDREDKKVWEQASQLGLPMVGICRGGQFLNVMNGGKMYQHVVGHANGGTHELVDTRSGEVLQVSSTHHQMMREGERGEVIAHGGNLCKTKEEMDSKGVLYTSGTVEKDVEVVLYKDTLTLCFQPHPEFFSPLHECPIYFHKLLKEIV